MAILTLKATSFAIIDAVLSVLRVVRSDFEA